MVWKMKGYEERVREERERDVGRGKAGEEGVRKVVVVT